MGGLGRILGHFRAILGDLGGSWALSWGDLGGFWGHLRAYWSDLGGSWPSWGDLGVVLVGFGWILGQFGRILG